MSYLSNLLNQKLPSQQAVEEAVTPDVIVDPAAASIEDELNDADLEINLEDIPEDTEMTASEEEDADKIIDLAATPVVLKETLGLESVRDFLESEEFDIACEEGFMIEGCRDAELMLTSSSLILESAELFTETKFYSKNAVRLTKQSKLNQLFEVCVQAVARAKNDVIYVKLQKVQMLRRKYKAILRQKYKSLALKKARQYLIRLKQSKSATLKSAAEQLDKK